MPPQSRVISHETARQALDWLVAMGADEMIGDEPINRLKPSSTPTITPVAALAAVLEPPSIAAESAVARSSGDLLNCKNLTELSEVMRHLDCPLQKTASNLCFATGREDAAVMVIGDVPGRDEDLSGKVFDGPQEVLLHRMLRAIGLLVATDDALSAASLFNFIPWRPPGNRLVTESEIAQCQPFVQRAISLAQPRAILAFGSLAAQRLTGRSEGLLSLRGKTLNYSEGEQSIPLIATFSPRHLLSQPAQKPLAWQDLLALKALL